MSEEPTQEFSVGFDLARSDEDEQSQNQHVVFIYHLLIVDKSRNGNESSMLMRSLSGPILQPEDYRGLIATAAAALDVDNPEDVLIRSLSFLHVDVPTPEEQEHLR